ncbi:carbamoyl-phosphate synthase small subunit [Terribacillus saccharophilus]|uniref:Carbamoyl phosphate synthase small chain n=1 Tax=Terribacillus saccharophilus TaxID=361277 RepID=A0A075LK18_9BACI|nr:carbamoyl phosphate synthase small subunit [Terribacillus goriensis]AIF66307.1 carbamoyl phosphate synthase small subunit [Terribacillus goriensis]SEM75850.1 carbamoyl-phosphate synthase small subunit [Terribacillus saccharophilus]
MKKRQLILEDGTVFTGTAFGSDSATTGEIVFNTGMTGYQEIISDPSYCGQIVTLTYPLIGNYGINSDDFESIQPSIQALVVKEAAAAPSNFRKQHTIDAFLKFHQIPGIAGIDTRKLTKIIRKQGAMKARLTEAVETLEKHATWESITLSNDQVQRMSTAKPYVVPGRGKRIVVMDFGMKHGILRELAARDCHITVVPWHYTAEQILHLNPDGIMLTNGPGDPKDVEPAIQTIRELIGQVPIFGICLGHQLIALAAGANTEKLKFGHRGSNHPVKDLETGKTYLTSQNHGYTVTKESLAATDLILTQVALNDGTVEGLKHRNYPVMCVQYHPEAAPGPEDTRHLFDNFLTMTAQIKQTSKEEATYA